MLSLNLATSKPSMPIGGMLSLAKPWKTGWLLTFCHAMSRSARYLAFSLKVPWSAANEAPADDTTAGDDTIIPLGDVNVDRFPAEIGVSGPRRFDIGRSTVTEWQEGGLPNATHNAKLHDIDSVRWSLLHDCIACMGQQGTQGQGVHHWTNMDPGCLTCNWQ